MEYLIPIRCFLTCSRRYQILYRLTKQSRRFLEVGDGSGIHMNQWIPHRLMEMELSIDLHEDTAMKTLNLTINRFRCHHGWALLRFRRPRRRSGDTEMTTLSLLTGTSRGSRNIRSQEQNGEWGILSRSPSFCMVDHQLMSATGLQWLTTRAGESRECG